MSQQRTGKPNGRPRKNIDVAEARRMMDDEKLSIRVTARLLKVPRATLCDHLHRKLTRPSVRRPADMCVDCRMKPSKTSLRCKSCYSRFRKKYPRLFADLQKLSRSKRHAELLRLQRAGIPDEVTDAPLTPERPRWEYDPDAKSELTPPPKPVYPVRDPRGPFFRV
jgi:transposase-like protein